MSSLPSGTVTFCFTDMEGSTRAFAKLGPRFLDVLEDHRRIIRDSLERHGGAEVTTEGDGFFLAFADPAAALSSVIEFQRALSAHDWPEGCEVRVRAGLHVGEAVPRNGDYVVYAVHEAARISAVAHGGQTLISGALAAATDQRLPPDASLRELGTHELKDIGPVRLYQLCHPALREHFPPLRSAGAARGYVPEPTSSLIGRSADIAELTERTTLSRLVTVTGAGGVGKTRIAVETARSALGLHPDGVWFVDLAPLSDPTWVPDAILTALGAVRDPHLDSRQQLLSYLAARDALIVIDNCEHLVESSSSLVAAVLAECPRVSILATSRESLGIPGELTWRAPSLPAAEGVDLFVERARLVVSDFEPDDATRVTIAQIVERLDGIPLAIELAAARSRVLTPAQIAERLDDRFRLLVGGSRTALARQRTLEAAVDWSYDLLDEEERALLRALSVFVGGFELEAAESVGRGNVLDVLERLVDKSLVGTRLIGDRIRYRLLETVRDYARRKLLDADEVRDTRDRHLAYFADLVDRVADGLRDSRESQAAETLTLELDNIRAATEHAVTSDDGAFALRIVSGMWLFWDAAGRAREGLSWIDRTLARFDVLDAERLALAHTGAAHLGWLAREPNDKVERHVLFAIDHMRERRPDDVRWYDAFAFDRYSATSGTGVRAAGVAVEALTRARRAGDAFTLATVLIAFARRRAELEGPQPTLDAYAEAVDVARTSGGSSILAFALSGLSAALAESGDIDAALELAQQAVAAANRGPNLGVVCAALGTLGVAKELRGDPDAAAPLLELIDVALKADLDGERASAEIKLGWLELGSGRPVDARARFEAAAELLASVAIRRPELLFEWAVSRFGIGEVCQACGDMDEARSIFGQLLALAENTGGLRWTFAHMRNALAGVDLENGSVDTAEQTYRQALELVGTARQSIVREMQTKASSLRGLAAVAMARGDAERAAFLSGAAAHIFEPTPYSGRVSVARNAAVVARAREALGEARFASQWARGHAVGLDRTAGGVLRLWQ